ncbi:hypothetical protein T08_940 [Trichinella sp. T8]|nr:hypothetical protein T08_940 [Trichinella sp. T8]
MQNYPLHLMWKTMPIHMLILSRLPLYREKAFPEQQSSFFSWTFFREGGNKKKYAHQFQPDNGRCNARMNGVENDALAFIERVHKIIISAVLLLFGKRLGKASIYESKLCLFCGFLKFAKETSAAVVVVVQLIAVTR